MKKPSKLSLKISHAIARRIKANQAQRAGVFAFKEAPKIVPRPSSPMSKALSKGAFVVGGGLASLSPLQAYWSGWISNSNLGNQSHIGGYVYGHSVPNQGWLWSRGNDFYHNEGSNYYCANYNCNTDNPVTLHNNDNLRQFYLSQFNWKGGGNFNLALGNASLNLGYTPGALGANKFESYYKSSYYFNDTFNAGSITISQDLTTDYTNLNLKANSITTQGYNSSGSADNSHVTISASNDSQGMNLNAQTENFNNTTFTGNAPFNFNSNNITFNQVTYNATGGGVVKDNGTLNFTNNSNFTLNTASPFANLGNANVNLNSVVFNITKDLTNNANPSALPPAYTIINTTGKIDYNSYTSRLWDLIHYDGVTGSLDSNGYTNPSGGNGLYHVSYEINGKQYIFGETFSNNTVGVQFITYKGPPQSIWDGVYNLYNNQNYNVGSGIGYIDPGTGTAQTWSSGGGRFGASLDQGTGGTLVIGNKTETPNTQGKILFGGTGIHSGDVGYITGSFKAQNIYLTSTIESGNAWATGGGTNFTFTASKSITADGLTYDELKAGTQQSNAKFEAKTGTINIANSSFSDHTRGNFTSEGGTMDFNAQNTTFNNSQFSGDQSQISLTGTQTLTLTDTQINNGMSTISLNAGTLNMDCDGKHGSCAPDFNNNPPFGASGFSGINAEHLLVNAQTATFTNTTLNIDPVSGANAYFSTNNLTFNNTTFSGDNTFSFKADNKGGQVTTFEGTTTLDTATNNNQATSPFATALSGQVILGSNAVFNVQNTLNNPAKAYTVLDTQNAIQAGSQDYLNTYAGRLWQLIHYQGQSASSAQQVTGAFIFNNQTYNIPTADKAYMVSFGTARFLETFGNNSMALQYVSQAADVWKSVYPMQNEPNVPQSYNVGANGVAFIDPAHNHSDPGYNPGDNSLSANSQVSGGATDTTIIGNNATLVIGNDQLQAIGLNAKQRASVNLDPSEKTGNSSSTTLSAPNVLLTNDLNIGSSKGGSGDLNISAQNTMTMDGLDFNATGSQQTNQNTFTGTQSLNIQNSNLNANGGALSLNSQNIQLNHANLTGQSDATITLNASSQSSNTPTQINAANTNLKDSGGSIKLNAQNITLGTSTQGTLYDKSASGAVSGAVDFTTNNTALSIAATGALNAANTTFNTTAGSATLSGNDVTIASNTSFSGNATNIKLNATNTLDITGQKGQATFTDPSSSNAGVIALQGQNIKLNSATFAGNGNSVKILGAGGSGATNSLNATDTDFNNSQDVNINANSATFTNGNFNDDQSINIASSGDGNFNNTNFNTTGNININAGDADTFSGTNFNTTADVNITAHNKATFENNSHFTKAQNISITANTASFEDTTFNTTGSADNVFKIANATFDGATFNTHSAYNFSGNTQTTFSGITNIGISGDTTFAKNLGDVDFSKGSLLSLNENEILDALKGGKAYTLLSGSKIDYDAQYAHSLYQMVQFGNTATTLAKDLKGGATQGGDTWYVSLGGETVKESFGANALTFSLYVPPPPPKPKPQAKPQTPSTNTPDSGQSGPNIAGTGAGNPQGNTTHTAGTGDTDHKTDSGTPGTHTADSGEGRTGGTQGAHTASSSSGSSSGTDNSGDNTHTASSGTGQATGNTGSTTQGSHTASSGTSSAGSSNSDGNTHTTQGSGDSGNNAHTASSAQGTHTADSGAPGGSAGGAPGQDQHNMAGNSGQGSNSGGQGSGTQGQGGTHTAQSSPGVTPPQPIPQNVNSMDIWKDVYDMDNSQTWSPNVGANGIAYIDPSHNHNDPGYNQPGLPQNSLTANATYQAWPPHNYTGSSTAVQGNNATLVIGNDQIKAVGLNDPRSVVWLDPSESGTEHSETSLQADNVFMTNNFFIGRTSSTDGTGDIGIIANKTMAMDGLRFTAYSGTGSAISNYSWDKFKSLGSLNIQNSQFANGGGALYFSTPTASVNNAQFSGNGTTIGFNAFNQTNPSVVNNNPNTNNITPGQMSFANTTFSEQAAGHILINGSSVNLGSSTQGTKYTGTSPVSGAVSFSGNNTDISIASTTGNISANNTSFKEQAGGNISLKSGQNLTIGANSANPTNDSSYTSQFVGNNTNISLSATQALSVSNTLFNDPLNNANSPQSMSLSGQSITLNNDKFEGYSQYHFNAQGLTLSGTTTIATNNYLNGGNVATSPFSTYAGNVSFGSKALLDLSNTQEIISALQGGTYTLLSGKDINYASDTTYAKNLWQMVQFGGQSATLATQGLPQGVTQGQNGIYYVSLDGQTIEENFGAKSLTLSLLNQEKDVWWDVYTMTPGCSPAAGGGCVGWPHWDDIVHGGYKTYSTNVGTNGIAYIDPTQKEAEGWSNGNTLSTYTGAGNGMHLQVQGSDNTLVIGNDTKQAATGGIVRLGGISGIYKIDVGYITDTLNAANIFMTNTFQTGNAAKTGGGANVSFTATNNITLDGLNYQNLKAGTQHSNANFQASADITATNSNFVDNSGGVFNFHGQNDTFTNSTFSGDSSQINIDATNTLSLANTNLNNGMSTISLNATNTLTMGPGANGTPSTAGAPASAINAESLNVTANTATFNDTSFTLDPTSDTTSHFKVSHLTFNNDTFEGIGSTYSFTGTQNTTFLGTNTIATTDLSNNPNSPFQSLGGNVTLGSNARFDIGSPLTYNKAYTLLQGSHINWNDDSYAKELWGLVQYQGMNAISAQSDGNNSWTVEFGSLATPIKVKETFNNNEIQLTLLSQIQDIWPDVYTMTPGCAYNAIPIKGPPYCTYWDDGIKTGFKTYNYNTNNAQNYVAYIDPNLKIGASPYNNPNGDQLSTYTSFGNGGHYNVEGEGTLIIGNNTNAAATGGTIWFGIADVGYITDTFDAYNVYLTNTIKVGHFALGGGASMTYTARNNLTADGLNYDQIATAFPGIQTNSSQHSSAYFIADKNMSILNSNFSDASWGLFSFSAHNGNMSFTGSEVQGSATAVTLDSPNVALTNTNFYLGRGSNLNIENSNQGGGGTLSATGSTFSLNEQSHAKFGTNANFNNSTVLLNNGATASFSNGGTFAGNSALDADNSTLSVSGNASFSNGAVLSLINHGIANLQTATFADNANVNVDQGSQANFSGAVTFNDTSSLNVNGAGASATLGAATFNAGTHMILNGGASTSITGDATFNGGNVNLNNSALKVGGSATLNSANFALQGTSSFDISGGASSSGTTNLSLYGTDPLSVGQNFGVSGVLNFKGVSSPSSVPLVKVGGTFDLSKTGLLDLSNVDLSTALGAAPKVYNIVDAKSIQGISGADGYQKIDFYGMQIQNATYNAANNSWSFANPLNGAELITERIENGDLSVTISSNPNPVATNLFNIAPELFYYKQSKQNIVGTDYDYSDDRVGTFFLDSNFKGVFIPPATSKINPIQPEIPGTFNGYNQPLDPLNIYNAGISQADFGPLLNIASTLWPTLEKLLASGVLNDLSDPAKVMQALGSVQVNLTPAQKQELLSVIAGFDSKINQTFQNGNLVVGGTELGQVNSTSKVWFGGNGYAGTCTSGPSCQELRNTYLGQLFGSTAVDLGYIEAQFNAKNIYITGTVGSGNAWQIGGSAEVSFNSATNLVLNQANIEAQGTDQIFPLLGVQGLDKILGQPGLGEVLGNLIYQKSLGADGLVPKGLSLPGSIANETLGQIFSAQDLGAVFTIPGMANILKDILSSKTVGSLLGSGGLISSLSQSEQDKIYGMLSNEIDKGLDTLSPAAKAAAQAGLGVAGGVQGAQHLINTFYSKDTLLTLIDQIAPMTGMTLNQALAQANSPQATTAMQKFLNDTTFGQIFSQIVQNSGLINKTVSWLGPQILTDIMNMAIADALNPPKALQNMAEDVGIKVLDQVLGANTMDTLKNLANQKAVSNILDSIIDNKGLGALWANGLGSVLPSNIQKALQKAGVGALLAPKGLSALWEKGYFNFAAHENVLSNNSNYSNETGGTLSFIAGNQIIFSGKNNINFSNYQGTLNFFSNHQSNIDLTSLNATNGLNLNAQFENLSIAGGTIALNQYESLAVSAQNFNFLGTINDTGGLIDLTGITGANVISTMNLQGASSLKTNNLSIVKALDNQSTNAINVGGDLTLYSGATLTTQAQGINIGGVLNSQGDYVFNLNPNSNSSSTNSTSGQSTNTGTQSTDNTNSQSAQNTNSGANSQSPGSAGGTPSASNNPTNPSTSAAIQDVGFSTIANTSNTQNAGSSNTQNQSADSTSQNTSSVNSTNSQNTNSTADSQSADNGISGSSASNQSSGTNGANGANSVNANPNTPLVQVQGVATLDASSNTMITFQGDAANTYTLLDSQKWMRYGLYQQDFNPNSWKDYLTLYTYLNINGKSMQLNKQGNGLVYDGQAVKIADRGLLVSYQNAQGQTIQASIAFDNIKLGVNKNLNVGMPNIEKYIAHIQGEGSVRAVYDAGGPGVMGWLNQLLIDTKNTPLFAAYYLEDNSQAQLVKIAKDIANSIDLVASPTLKATTSRLLQINTFTQQMSRLAKLSSFASNDTLLDFHDFLVSLKGKKFASAVPNDMDIITAYSQRNKLKNNLWITGVGGASFVAGGTGTLYGVNMGYDRFIKGVIVGGYAAYGYSGFYGNITNSASNNVNVGVYSRAFLKGRHEITGSANETWGYNNAYINATDPILSIVNQRYDYSTWTTNLRANYGYDFFFRNKRVILKPQIGLAYYYIGLSGLQGTMNNPFYNQFRANADPANKSVLTLNLALESRHYFNKNSYYFVLASIGRDLFVHSMGDKVVRFIGDDMLSYRNGGMYNTFAGLTTGGEIRLFRSFYINASIGARFGLDYQDINITGNVGMRYAF